MSFIGFMGHIQILCGFMDFIGFIDFICFLGFIGLMAFLWGTYKFYVVLWILSRFYGVHSMYYIAV